MNSVNSLISSGTPVDETPAHNTSFKDLSGLWGDDNDFYATHVSNRVVVKISWSSGNLVSIFVGGGSTVVSSIPIAATDALLRTHRGL